MERNGIKMKLSRVGGIHVTFLNEMINYLEYGKEVFFFLLLGKVLLLSKGQQERTTLG